MGWYDNGHMGWGGWIVMVLIVSLFLVALIFAGIMLLRSTNNRSGTPAARNNDLGYRDPVEILDERFARGELEIDEYQARKAALGGAKR